MLKKSIYTMLVSKYTFDTRIIISNLYKLIRTFKRGGYGDYI